jgi:hypothetical protein
MITVARLPLEQAHMLKGRLDSEGIPAFVPDEHTYTAISLTGDSFAGLRVQVRDEDAERARAVLQMIRETTPGPQADPEPFVSQAKSLVTTAEWIEGVMGALLVAALLYHYLSS